MLHYHRKLAESELFGHEAGAFTGASGAKRGLLELAEGGTLLLNEIGELSLSLQAKLLTFIDTRSLHESRGREEHQGKCSAHRCNQSRAREGGSRGQVSDRSLLQIKRTADQGSFSAGTERRYSNLGTGDPDTNRCGTAITFHSKDRFRQHEAAQALSMAGKRARTAKRPRARIDYLRLRGIELRFS